MSVPQMQGLYILTVRCPESPSQLNTLARIIRRNPAISRAMVVKLSDGQYLRAETRYEVDDSAKPARELALSLGEQLGPSVGVDIHESWSPKRESE